MLCARPPHLLVADMRACLRYSAYSNTPSRAHKMYLTTAVAFSCVARRLSGREIL